MRSSFPRTALRLLLLPLLAACHSGGGGHGSPVDVPSSLDFGTVLQGDPFPALRDGSSGIERPLVIRNRRGEPVRLSDPGFTGDAAAEFTIGGLVPEIISPHGSVTIPIVFLPSLTTGDRRARFTIRAGSRVVRVALRAAVVSVVSARLATAPTPGPLGSDAALGEDGGAVVWIEGTSLQGAFLDREGGVRPVAGTGTPPPLRTFPVAAGLAAPFGGPRARAVEKGFLVAVAAGGDVLAIRLRGDGVAEAPANLTNDAAAQGSVAMASTDARALVAWHHAGQSVEAVVLALDGTVVVPRFTVTTDVSGLPPGGDGVELAAATDGERFFVVHRDAQGGLSGIFVSLDGVPGAAVPAFPAGADVPAVASDGEGWLVAASLPAGPEAGVHVRLFDEDGALIRDVALGGPALMGSGANEDQIAAAGLEEDEWLVVRPEDGRLVFQRVTGSGEVETQLSQALGGAGFLPLPALAAHGDAWLLAADLRAGPDDAVEALARSTAAARIVEWDLDPGPGIVYRPFQVDYDPTQSDPLRAGPWITYSGVGTPGRNKVAHLDPATGRFLEYRVSAVNANLGLHGVHAARGKVWFTSIQLTGSHRVSSLDPITREVLNVDLPMGSGPHEVLTDEDGRVWVTLADTDRLATWDPVAGTLAFRTLPLAMSGPHGLLPRRNPSTSQIEVWLTERSSGKLARLQPAAPGGMDRWDEWTIPGFAHTEPLFVAVDAQGRAWTAIGRSDRLARLDPVGNLLGFWPLPLVTANPGFGALSGPLELVIEPDGRIAYNAVGTSEIGFFAPGDPIDPVTVPAVTTMTPAPIPAAVVPTPFTATVDDVVRPPTEARLVGPERFGEFQAWLTVLSGEGPPTGYPGNGVTRMARVGTGFVYTETLIDRVGWLVPLR